jgi:hypothetical protein
LAIETNLSVDPKPDTEKAGEGNRTLVSSLGSWRSTIELHPQNEEVKVMVKRE